MHQAICTKCFCHTISSRVSKLPIHHSDSHLTRLKAGEITELPGHLGLYADFPKPVFQRFMAIFEMWTIDGTSTISASGRILNAQFPDIRTLTAREMLDTYWSKGLNMQEMEKSPVQKTQLKFLCVDERVRICSESCESGVDLCKTVQLQDASASSRRRVFSHNRRAFQIRCASLT